ncbi:MAG: hypothetical protein GF355_08460 [Candidatus Eisenbacteria bacterium]|nr:hypothetical protein [Candidatus Eisenbacteria bacterium]
MRMPRGCPRVAISSHDTYGLGHLTRSARIARGIAAGVPGASVLILTGSPIAHRFTFPPGVDYLKLPSVVKAGPETYVARELKISNSRVRRLRSRLILDALRVYDPHLFLVDNVPLGMKGELLPSLVWLRKQRPRTYIQLNMRDILDAPGAILASWERQGIHAALADFYDAIEIFGKRRLHDSVRAYRLPKDKSSFLGYIAPFAVELEAGPPLPPSRNGHARILATAGGGGDGGELLACAIELQRKLGTKSPYQFHIVTGPLMPAGEKAELRKRMRGVRGVTLHDYVVGLPSWMAECDAVLSMGGYNTLCEVLSVAQRSIVVPRIHPRREQEIRARTLEGRGWIKVLHPEALNPLSLDRRLQETLQVAPLTNETLPMTGIPRLQRRIRRIVKSIFGDGARRAGAAASKDAAGASIPPPS